MSEEKNIIKLIWDKTLEHVVYTWIAHGVLGALLAYIAIQTPWYEPMEAVRLATACYLWRETSQGFARARWPTLSEWADHFGDVWFVLMFSLIATHFPGAQLF